MQRLLQVLFWSIITAAFIGPGTVATAASAGAGFGLSLLWALLFSAFACYVLQEASARLTIVSGKNLGQAIRWRFHGKSWRGGVVGFVSVGIFLGCAAYEAGNILGGVAGAVLGTGLPPQLLTVVMAAAAALLLYLGTIRTVARILGGIVALMGIAFTVTAVMLSPSIGELISGLFVPRIPEEAGILVLGLIGTTVVPYNLFLGSGIARGQAPGAYRFGLAIAILLGGLISMAVLVVGTAISGTFEFPALSSALSTRLGGWSNRLFAMGLFAAGFSSAITAPLAAAVTVRSLVQSGKENPWPETSWNFRAIWLSVLGVGTFFGLTGIQPIPAIILAQALNGMLLPVIALFLFFAINDSGLMGRTGRNRVPENVAMGFVVVLAAGLGGFNLMKALGRLLGISTTSDTLAYLSLGIVIGLSLWLAVYLVKANFRISGK